MKLGTCQVYVHIIDCNVCYLSRITIMEHTLENNFYFPKEVLTHIFSFVDPHTLVFSCRLVCRFWRDTVEIWDVWKILIFREYRSKFKDNYILSKAHLTCPWYVCYSLCHNKIFFRNLLCNCCCSEDNMTHLREVLSVSEGFICSAPIEVHSQGFTQVPHELLSEGVATCFLSTVGECSINQTIDLYAHGFTRKIMELRPSIHISEWFAVGYTFSGVCHLEVTFFDSNWKHDFENGLFRHTQRIERRQWLKVTHTFTDYCPDVRYITYNHGVDTYWSQNNGRYVDVSNHGNAAAKMVAATVLIALPDFSGTPTN